MSLEGNLAAARNALRHIQGTPISSSNKASHRIAFAGGIEAAIRSDRPTGIRDGGELRNALRWIRRGVDRTDNNIGTLLAAAAETRRQKLGNCFELCELIVERLYYLQARPVDLMGFTRPGYDHAFVIIGLAQSASQWRPVPGQASHARQNVRAWGDEAVWCDPWQRDGLVFPVADLVKGAVRNLDFRLRCHDVDAINEGEPVSMFRLD